MSEQNPPSTTFSAATLAADQSFLELFLRTHHGVAGTVHRVTGPQLLGMTAAHNIPPKVQDIVRTIPLGKGMAGLAFERNEPVTTCNIKTDNTGQVKPGAKAIDAHAGVALPVHDANGQVRAVVGIAYMEEKTLLESELAALAAAAKKLAE